MIEKVVEKNEEVRCAVRKNARIIRQYAGRELTETELGYITVHICAAIERKKNKEIAFHDSVVKCKLWSFYCFGALAGIIYLKRCV